MGHLCPPGTTYRQFLQMLEAAGYLPEILLLDDLHDDTEAYEYAIRKGLIRSYSLAELSEYMPGYMARFKQYGTDVSFAFSENTQTTGQAGTGKLWYIPFQFNSTASRQPGSRTTFPNRRPTPASREACSVTTC
ncbi:MAG: hypothetical protein A2177_07810 [Spirochaetes bacterium RBG_13_68_11]|nr:MAG: hypothetical protein A2177_07810 [Spirochaetes bacterium RBG_13_68_11]